VLVIGLDASSVFRLPVPDNLYFALVTPDIAVPTAHARAVLPASIPLKTMVTQTGLAAAVIHALHTNDLALLARVMQQDTIIAPARASLIPGLAQAHDAARDAGALVSIISGAGPTLCAFCDSPEKANAAADAFGQVYDALGIANTTRTARPNLLGAIPQPVPLSWASR
jgi:homoserine kinase